MDKLYGWIVSNGCLKTSKYMEMIALYEESAKKQNIYLRRIFNNELIIGVEEGHLFYRGEKTQTMPDFVLFLDKDIRLAVLLEHMGLRLFNKSTVIEACDDKSKTFQFLAGHHIPMPKTIIAPLVYNGYQDESDDYLDYIEKELCYPIVIKESFGSFGEQVYLVKNRQELIKKHKQLLYVPHIYQQFIASSRGKDVRINVVGQKVSATMLRTSDTDFRANITNGGKMHHFIPPEAFEHLALKVCEIIGADFAGVDLLFGENEEPILCEINSNAHIKNIQQCTGINVADDILRHIIRELKDV